MENISGDKKTFNIRVPKEIWSFLKKMAFEHETSMVSIIVKSVEEYKKKLETKKK